MVEPKVSLSLLVPGATMLSPQESGKNPKNYDIHRINVEYKKGNKVKKETLTVHTRKNRLVTQHMNVSKEAYDYMIETPVDSKLKRTWATLPKTERLNHHFNLIARDLGAVHFSYEILQD